MSDAVLIAIDAGGTTVKVVAYTLSGVEVASETAHVDNIHYDDGRVERDFAPFWAGIVSALRRIVQDCAGRPILGVGCTGFGNGIFLLDEAGEATRPGIVSVDHRAQPLVDRLTTEGGAEALTKLTGNRIWGGQTLMVFAHLAETEPEVMARTRWALCCKDAIRFKLTGQALTDPTDAGGGGMMDSLAGTYAAEALEMLGLSAHRHRLPDIVPSDATAGRISAQAARETGLPEGVPVAGSMMDVAACSLGAGAVGPDILTMIAGTWSINSLESTAEDISGAPILNFRYGGPDRRLIAEGSPSSAANLGWYLGQALGGRVSLEEANALVADSAPEARRCQFLPYVFGPDPKRGCFLDMGATDDAGTMLRAIFEGVAFQALRHAEEAVALSGRAFPPVIRLAGGAAKSPVWTQIFADVCQRPVEAVHAGEVGALGAAICAAVAVGVYEDLEQAAEWMTKIARRHEPNPEFATLYEERFARFRHLDAGVAALMEERPQSRGADKSREEDQ